MWSLERRDEWRFDNEEEFFRASNRDVPDTTFRLNVECFLHGERNIREHHHNVRFPSL